MNNVKLNETSPTETFSRKYTHASGPARLLIDRFFRSLSTLVCRVQPLSIIEVGCGPGYSTEILANIAPTAELAVCDIEPDLIELTGKRVPRANLSHEDIHHLTYQNASADLVVCLEVFEHIADPKQALAEIARVTRRYAIISVPREPIWRILNMLRGVYWKDLGNTPGHINHWSTSSFRLFVNQQFTIIDHRLPLPWTMFLLEKKTP